MRPPKGRKVARARQRMSIRVDMSRGYDNMIGTEFQGVGLKPSLVFFNVIRGKTSKMEKLVKSSDGDNDSVFSGKFFSQDSYMFVLTERKSVEELLKAKRGGSEFKWKIFIWKGEGCSLIQFGMAGTKANELQKMLVMNGNFFDCAIIKERQGEESQEFLDLFGGEIEVTKGTRVKASVPNSGDAPVAKIPKLYEVHKDRLTRVAINIESLKDDRNYILDICNAVYSYSGPKCGRVERAYTEEMARRRCVADYRKKIKARHVDPADKKNVDTFKGIVSKYNQTPWETETFDPVLLVVKDGELQSLPMTNEGEKSDLLLDAEVLKPGKCFVLDCGSEIYVWLGKGLPPAEQKKGFELGQQLTRLPFRPSWCSVQVVREKMETIFFKERFFGFDQTDLMEVGGHVRNIKDDKEFLLYEKDREKAQKLRRVSGELKRITQFLKESDKFYDTAEQLDLAKDTSGTLKALKYDEKGKVSVLEEAEFGFFETNKMYNYIYSCKNDTMHIIWTWEGKDSSTRAKAVSGIMATGKDIPGLADELMGTKVFKHVTQGQEPRLLTLILEERGKNFFLLKRNPTVGLFGKQEKKKSTNFFMDSKSRKINVFEINEIGRRGARCTEIPMSTLQKNGFYKKTCYLIMRGPTKKQNLFRHPSFMEFHVTDAFIYEGSETTEACRELVRKLAKDASLPKTLGFQDFMTLEFDAINLHKGDGADFLEEMKLFVNDEEILPAATRPTRLISSSFVLRKMKRMFILDIGNGVFAQNDLKPEETFILDTGSSKVFLWIGNACIKDQINLGIESVTRYCYRELKHFGVDITKGDITLELVDAGMEPMSFRSCFYGWHSNSSGSRQMSDKLEPTVNRYIELALMDDNERRAKEEKTKTAVRQKNLDQFRQRKSVRMSRMKSLRKGRLVTFKKVNNEVSIKDRVGDVIDYNRDSKTLIARKVDKPLRLVQDDIPVEDIVKSIHSGSYTWALFKYLNVRDVAFVCRGSEGTEELIDQINKVAAEGKKTKTSFMEIRKRGFQRMTAMYAILKIPAEDLKTVLTPTDRYLFITFIPEDSKPALRAAVNSHHKTVKDILGPFSAELTLRKTSDLTTEKAIEIASHHQ